MTDPIHPGRLARPWLAPAAALLVAGAALLAGCSKVPEREVLARVGTRVLTADDFRSIAKDNAPQYPFAPDSAKHAMLDDMVRRELMLVAGQRLGLDKDSAVVAARAVGDDDLLARSLFERLAPNDVAVSDSEVAQLHRWRGTKNHVMLLYTPARANADRAVADLKAGHPFAKVSEQFGQAGVVPPGGDLGWMVAGQLVDPLDQLVRDAALGVPLGPVAAPTEGWLVALVTERQPQPTGSLEEEKPFLKNMLRQRKQRTIAMKAFQQLREQYHVAVDPRGPLTLFQLGSAGGATTMPDTTQVLATYDGDRGAHLRYTVGDAMKDMANPARDRPPFQSTAALQTWIDGQVIPRVAVIEARRRHLEKEPDVARRIRARVENAMLQRVYELKVMTGLDVTDDEVLAHYTERAAMFTRTDSTGRVIPPPAFAALPENLRQGLRQEALMMKRDARLRELTTEIEHTVKPFEVHPERLQRLEWPAPEPTAMQGMPGGMPSGHP